MKEYRAVIQSTTNGPMARVTLFVSQHVITRWVSPAMILGRYTPKIRFKQPKAQEVSESEIVDIEQSEASSILRPTKVGQIVEIQTRGAAIVAARVTKVYLDANSQETQNGEPVPTHVDACFILGNAHTEKMIPIESVRLAPELDPNAGRGRRQTAKQLCHSDENDAKIVPRGTKL